jgi:disulfide bond formation protein DsbB
VSLRIAGAVTALAALAALGVAYYAQDFLNLFPCPLCLWERWPYRIVVLLGILAVISPRWAARILLSLAVLALLAGAAISFVHVGVEFHWWQSPLPECNGILTPGAPLPMTPAKPCDAPSFLIPDLPVSMAAMDLLYALAFAFVLAIYLIRKPRRDS